MSVDYSSVVFYGFVIPGEILENLYRNNVNNFEDDYDVSWWMEEAFYCEEYISFAKNSYDYLKNTYWCLGIDITYSDIVPGPGRFPQYVTAVDLSRISSPDTIGKIDFIRNKMSEIGINNLGEPKIYNVLRVW